MPTPSAACRSKPPRRPFLLYPAATWSLIALLLVLFFVLVGITILSETHNGLFTIRPREGIRDDIVRSVWSSGPTLLMAVINGGILCPMALAIYLVAPYAALDEGPASAKASIGANYATQGGLGRLRLAISNRKWGLISLSILTFLAIWLEVPASGLIESRNVIVCIPCALLQSLLV
jgi:hypothetical protein